MKQRLTEAKLYKLTDSLLKITERQLSEYKSKLSLLEEKEVEQRNFYNGQIGNLQNQISIYKEQITGYETINARLTRQLKFNKLLSKGLFVTVIVAALKIFFIK